MSESTHHLVGDVSGNGGRGRDTPPVFVNPAPESYEENDENEYEEYYEDESEHEEAAGSEVQPTAVSTPSKKGRVPSSKGPANLGAVVAAGPPKPPAPSKRDILDPRVNPFPITGQWKESTLKDIEIVFPDMTNKNESTNELTRASHPEARYWKSPISFKFSTFRSDTLRFFNVSVPYHNASKYGQSFIYIALPGFAADVFSQAGKTKRPTIVNEKSLVPDSVRWWKIVNNIEGKIGVINQTTKGFVAKPLASIFASSGKGVIVNLELSFVAKMSTDNKEPFSASTAFTIQPELIRGYIVGVDQDIDKPTRVVKKKAEVKAKAVAMDLPSDDLMKRLSEMGI